MQQQHQAAQQTTLQPERSNTLRSRPSSAVGSESPSSRSSDSFKRETRNSTKRISASSTQNHNLILHHQGSVKKKIAPSMPRPVAGGEDSSSSGGGSNANIYAHVRQTSDPAPVVPTYAQIERKRSNASGHWRNHSVDLTTPQNGSLAHISDGNKTIATSKHSAPNGKQQTNANSNNNMPIQPIYSSLQRPRVPPPPLPPHQNKIPERNGQTRDLALTSDVDVEMNRLVPVPPPRKSYVSYYLVSFLWL